VIEVLEDYFQYASIPRQAVDSCPIYMVLGRPQRATDEIDDAFRETTEKIVVSLKLIDPAEISFTFPDSMASAEIVLERSPKQYEPEYPGKVLPLKEIEAIVEKRGMPGDTWKPKLHHHRPH
jgi:hypothetical protein